MSAEIRYRSATKVPGRNLPSSTELSEDSMNDGMDEGRGFGEVAVWGESMNSVARSSALDTTVCPHELQNLLEFGTSLLQDEQYMNIATVTS